MSKTKVLSILVGALIIINAVVLAWVVFGNKQKHRPNGKRHFEPKQIIIERLNFSEDQVLLYESTIIEHRETVRKLEEQIKSTKNELYSSLSADSATNKDHLMTELSQLLIQMENVHYNHFQEIKSICKADQIDEFKNLTQELARFFAPHPMNRPKKK